MNNGIALWEAPGQAPVWEVAALCRAVADALHARFNPLVVRGEISGFVRAASGHCYFSLRNADAQMDAQIRCAMFRRAAGWLDFAPSDGALVQVTGRLDLYGPRGDLQLIVEHMQQAGQGALFEQFMRLKARLEAEGLFAAARKRPLPVLPRGIGLVTSPAGAALHDVVTALRRRAPHVPLLLAPAQVQGADASAALVAALQRLYRLARQPSADLAIDVILLVRGGGSIEDLWAFNDEQLARTLVQSPVPVISGIGHETDFTIADFCADLRAPTPTAAAELACAPRQTLLQALQDMQQRLLGGTRNALDRQQQRLDWAVQRLVRPGAALLRQRVLLQHQNQRLHQALLLHGQEMQHRQRDWHMRLPRAVRSGLQLRREQLERLALRLHLLDPQQVLQRGYALLTDAGQRPVTHTRQAPPGTPLRARLADGSLDLRVTGQGVLQA